LHTAHKNAQCSHHMSGHVSSPKLWNRNIYLDACWWLETPQTNVSWCSRTNKEEYWHVFSRHMT